jgi:hypothetical protein
MKKVIKIMLKCIYYPIGYVADLLDYIGGKIEALDYKIQDFDNKSKPKN